MPADLDTLAQAFAQRRAMLFVGAGASMSVGLPSWRGLVEWMCRDLGLEVEGALDGDATASGYQRLAEYYRIAKGGLGPLRDWMAAHWTVPDHVLRASPAHSAIVALAPEVIYTTNYDRSLERAFELAGRPHATIVNAGDAARAADATTQIVKLHGDLGDEASLVITESDYFDRLAFDGPLDIKLQADALGRTVLFVGYSMSDPNVRLMLYRLWRLWRRSGREADRPRSVVFMPRASAIEAAILAEWGIDVVDGSAAASRDEALAAFLRDLRCRVEAARQG